MSKIGRNDPCHCGSGKKYKKCCWEKDEQEALAAFAEPEEKQAEEREPEVYDKAFINEDDLDEEDAGENDYVEEDDDEFDDTEDENTEGGETAGGMKNRPYPKISKEEKKIVNEWWKKYKKLEKPDDIKEHTEDFLAAYPHLAENLGLEHEVLFELGADLAKEGRTEVYIDFLLKMRASFPGVYSRSAGYYDADIIAWLVANRRNSEIGDYLSYYTEYPVEFVDQLFETLDLLIATDTAEPVPGFISKVCKELISSPDVISGTEILYTLMMHVLSKYISIENADAVVGAFMEEVPGLLPYELNEPDKMVQFWKQRVENIKRPFTRLPDNIPNKKSELWERYKMMCENFMRYLHEQTGVSWITAAYYAEMMQNYFEKTLGETKSKVKRQFEFSKDTMDKTIGSICGSFIFFNASKALSLLNAVYYFAGYLQTCGSIDVFQRSVVESDCKILFNEMYQELTKQFTAAFCFSEFPLWKLKVAGAC